MTYTGIIIGGAAGFLYWNFIGCTSGTCPITSNKFISIAYGALLGGLLISTIASSKSADTITNFFKGKDSTEKYKNINSSEMITLISDTNYVIIDVRTPGEWKSGFIEGADLFIDINSTDFEDQIRQLDKSKNYIVYCRSGNRSSKACEIMGSNGFKNLHNLSGGIKNWNGEIKKD